MEWRDAMRHLPSDFFCGGSSLKLVNSFNISVKRSKPDKPTEPQKSRDAANNKIIKYQKLNIHLDILG
jgi:hypothetical protein